MAACRKPSPAVEVAVAAVRAVHVAPAAFIRTASVGDGIYSSNGKVQSGQFLECALVEILGSSVP